MIKHRQDGLVALHGASLLVLIATAFLGSLAFVAVSGLIRFHQGVNWSLYFGGVLVAMVWIHHGLRGSAERLGALDWREAGRLAAHQTTRLAAVLFALAFATKDGGVSRIFLASFLGLAAGLLFVANLVLARWLARSFFRQRLRTVIVASQTEARLLVKWLGSHEHLGVEVIGYLTPDGEAAHADGKRLGALAELPGLLARSGADQIVFAREVSGVAGMAKIVRAAERAHCRVRYFVNLAGVFGAASATMETSGHYAFAATTPEPLANPCNRMLKRMLDVAVALPVVVFVLPPLTLLVWAMQRRESPGGVFYGQERSGLNRERFRIHKFRTMYANGSAPRGQQACAGDARIYPFGRFLRRSSLDEMPQFLNVLAGQMSVSGPRPHLPEHDESFAEREHAYFKRHYVKPGITGLAQSRGCRGEMRVAADLTNRVHYDTFYVTKWSLGLDVGILWRTVGQVISPPRTAY